MATKILKSVKKSVTFKTSDAHNPKAFYKDRKGLWVWSDFKSRVVEKAKQIKKGSTYKVSSFDLLKYATDEAIEKELPKKHLFRESDLCALIAEMLSKQPAGESGVLQNNGYANLFYTPGCVVGVSWRGSDWDVRAWDRGGRGWRGGYRVFSPQLSLKISTS